MANLNLNHLRYFWTVAHAGGLNRAAHALNVSQSAVSVQLQKLETQLGHRLFDRAGRTLELTEPGRIALDYADSIFEASEELIGTLTGRRFSERRVLKIGAMPTLSRNFQLEFLRPLAGRPNVEIVVRSGQQRELFDLLEAHELDVVLSNTPARTDAATPFRNRLLNRQPVSLIGRSRAEEFRFPDDLERTPLVAPSTESDIRLGFDRLLEQVGVRPNLVAEVDDMAMLRLLARELDAVALAPPIVVRDELSAGRLVELHRFEDLEERFYAITVQRRFPNPLLTEMLAQGVDNKCAPEAS